MLDHCADSIGSALPGGGGATLSPRVFEAPPGTSGNFTCPVDGFYLVTCWGGGTAGGTANAIPGSSGAVSRKLVFLSAGSVIAYSSGYGESYGRADSTAARYQPAQASTASGPGFNMSSGPGPRNDANPRNPAAATGGDLNLLGLVGSGATGANSPSISGHVLGDIVASLGGAGEYVSGSYGVVVQGSPGQSPGAGGGYGYQSSNPGGIGGPGGGGMVTIAYGVPA